jgi:hypothetical protein
VTVALEDARQIALARLRDAYGHRFPDRRLVLSSVVEDLGSAWRFGYWFDGDGNYADLHLEGEPLALVNKKTGKFSFSDALIVFDN